MKKYIFGLLLLIPFITNAQEFSSSMDKEATIKYINSIIKPAGNTGSISSFKTDVTYTENYFDKATRIIYSFNLAKVSITTKGNSVVLKCKSGSCIECETSSPGNKETKQITELTFESSNSQNLYKAFLHLKKKVGL